uniref:Uncharacterized protein n=1 Tax=viral metagenome TaxID=1070528 RepID=A0A6C0EYZ3_9ZZZZ
MTTIKTKYLILFWILALIIFTFYCIIRLYLLREKYSDVLPIASYVSGIQNIKNITDIPGCKNVYDDNYAVQTLGYRNCNDAYFNYLSKNLDVNNNYGQPKTLAQICPVSAKTPEYSKCLKSLINKYADGANALDSISTDMNTSINNRLQNRSNVMNSIDLALNPVLYSKDQNDFKTNMIISNALPNYPQERLGLVNNYYNDKYGDSLMFEGFNPNVSTYIVDPALEEKFFGIYKPINGQFLSFDNLSITLGYDITTESTAMDTSRRSSQTALNQVRAINLTITNPSTTDSTNDLQVIYTISNLDNYKGQPNAIKLVLQKQNVVLQPNDSVVVQQLLSVLGINAPSQIILVYNEYISTENIKHISYKLLNDNLDTIIVLEKI